MISNFDYILIGIVIVIFILGIFAISSATDVMTYGITREVKLQSISFGLGILALIIIQFINYEIVGQFYWWLYGLAFLFLAVLFIPGIGETRFGSRSWINLGPIDFQTSEVAKILYIIFFGKIIFENK